MTTKTETMNQLNQIIELANEEADAARMMIDAAFSTMLAMTEELDEMAEEDAHHAPVLKAKIMRVASQTIQEEFDASMAEVLRLQDKATEAWNAARDFHFHTIDNNQN